MSKQNANPLMVEQKKKKHLWGLWVPLIIIFSVIVLPLGIAAALFYDPSHTDNGITDEEKKNPPEKSLVFSSIMTDMFDGCRKEKDPTIDIAITQRQLNLLLTSASSGMTADSPLKQLAIIIKDDSKYIFDLEISTLTVVKTHLVIETKVQGGSELPDGQKGFLFEITNLKVGRLSGIQSVLPWLVNLTGIDFSNIFEAANLSIKFDIDNLRMTYSYKDFVKNLSDLSGTGNPLFLNIFSNFFSKEKVNFTHHENTDVTGVIDMAPYTYNADYSNTRYRINPMFGESNDVPMLTYFSSVAEDLLNNNVIPDDSDVTTNTLATIKFLSYGNKYLADNEIAFINSIYDANLKGQYCNNLSADDYSSIRKDAVFGNTSAGLMDDVTGKINDKLAVPGYKEAFLADLTGDNEAYLFDSGTPYVVKDDSVRTMLKGNDKLIGYGFGFIGKDNNDAYKVSYSVLDNIYPTIIPADVGETDKMALTFGLNINGTETLLVMPMEGQEVHNEGKHGLSFNLKDAKLFYGSEEFENLKDQLQTDVINKVGSTSDEDNMIQFEVNPENNNVEKINMIFDFKDYFDKEAAKPEAERSPFYNLNQQAEAQGAVLVTSFEFAETETGTVDANNHYGEFRIKLGYKIS